MNLYHLVTDSPDYRRKHMAKLHAIVQAETEEEAREWAKWDDDAWKGEVDRLPVPEEYPNPTHLSRTRMAVNGSAGLISVWEE